MFQLLSGLAEGRIACRNITSDASKVKSAEATRLSTHQLLRRTYLFLGCNKLGHVIAMIQL